MDKTTIGYLNYIFQVAENNSNISCCSVSAGKKRTVMYHLNMLNQKALQNVPTLKWGCGGKRGK